VGASGLSYHYYSLPDVVGYAAQVATRAADATRLRGAGVLSEFDVDLASPVVAPYSNLDLRGTLDAAEAVGHSWMGWAATSLWLGNHTLHIPSLREVARPYARAVAGSNASARFVVHNQGSGAGSLTLAWTLGSSSGGGEGGVTEVYVSTGLWWDVTTLTVAASPPGLVQWEWVQVPGTVCLPASNVTSLLSTEFAHALLRVRPTASAAAGARVTLVVTGGAAV
jgi:hypothetical protein